MPMGSRERIRESLIVWRREMKCALGGSRGWGRWQAYLSWRVYRDGLVGVCGVGGVLFLKIKNKKFTFLATYSGTGRV